MLAARLSLIGESPAHGQLAAHRADWTDRIRQMAADHFDQRVWVEKIRVETRSPRQIDALAERDDPFGDLVRQIRNLPWADADLADIRADLDAMLAVLPTDLRHDEGRVNLDDPQQAQALVEDAKELLLARLLRAEGDE